MCICLMQSHLKHIALAKIAAFTLGLEVLFNGFTTKTPSCYVVNV
jgi:hypothetical protein